VVVRDTRWRFPEDLVVDRAMLEALIDLLVQKDVIDIDDLQALFREKLKDYTESEERRLAPAR
jgi:hypothetical protein